VHHQVERGDRPLVGHDQTREHQRRNDAEGEQQEWNALVVAHVLEHGRQHEIDGEDREERDIAEPLREPEGEQRPTPRQSSTMEVLHPERDALHGRGRRHRAEPIHDECELVAPAEAHRLGAIDDPAEVQRDEQEARGFARHAHRNPYRVRVGELSDRSFEPTSQLHDDDDQRDDADREAQDPRCPTGAGRIPIARVRPDLHRSGPGHRASVTHRAMVPRSVAPETSRAGWAADGPRFEVGVGGYHPQTWGPVHLVTRRGYGSNWGCDGRGFLRWLPSPLIL
jgi:hypothetical protein